MLASKESSASPVVIKVNQTESVANTSHDHKLEENFDEHDWKDDTTSIYVLPKQGLEIPEELDKYLNEELDKVEQQLNSISSGGTGLYAQDELEKILSELDELEVEFHPVLSPVGESRFSVLHRISAPKNIPSNSIF